MAIIIYGVTLIFCTSVVLATTCYRREIDWVAYELKDSSFVYRQTVSDYCSTSSSCCGQYCCYYYDDTYYDTYYYYSHYDNISTGGIAGVIIGCLIGVTLLFACIKVFCLYQRRQLGNGQTRTARANISYVTGSSQRCTLQVGTSNTTFNASSVDLGTPTYSQYAAPPPSYDDVMKSTQRNQGSSEYVNLEHINNGTSSNNVNQS